MTKRGTLQQKERAARAQDIARRRANHETIQSIADDYGVDRLTIWRWHNQAIAEAMPAPKDREAWRAEIIPMLIDKLTDACEADDYRSIAVLSDRLAKLLGLDHSDALNEAMLRVKIAQMQVISQAITAAMTEAGLSPETQQAIIRGATSHVKALET